MRLFVNFFSAAGPLLPSSPRLTNVVKEKKAQKDHLEATTKRPYIEDFQSYEWCDSRAFEHMCAIGSDVYKFEELKDKISEATSCYENYNVKQTFSLHSMKLFGAILELKEVRNDKGYLPHFVVVFRGTAAPVNWTATNFRFLFVEGPKIVGQSPCKIHGGFYQAAESLYLHSHGPKAFFASEENREKLKNNKEIVFVGHSLGAGLAALNAYLFMLDMKKTSPQVLTYNQVKLCVLSFLHFSWKLSHVLSV